MKKNLYAFLLAFFLCIPALTVHAKATSLAELPGFDFSSGAGAWATVLNINTDGSFNGEYHDTDIDGTDTSAYNATTQFCQFSGKFTDIKQIDTYTYSMRVGSLKTVHTEGAEWIEEGIRYIASTPYGLPDIGGEVLLYLPGHDTSTLPEEFLRWYQMPNAIYVLPEKLPCFGLYNVSEQLGFSSSDEESAKALASWNISVDSSTPSLPPATLTDLQQFLVQFWWGWMDQTYDFRNVIIEYPTGSRGFNILQALIGDAICYAGPVSSAYPSHGETNWNGSDPLGKWSTYHKTSSATVHWILENVFNCSQTDISKLQTSLAGSSWGEYYFDGYYYSPAAGIGGPSPNAIFTDIRQYEKYYLVTYELRFEKQYGGDLEGRFFSVVERKTVDGREYWSLYYHRKLANGEVLNLPTSANSTSAVPAGKFSDVRQDAYFYDAVLWGVKQGIVSGTGANTFSPNNTCTKAQILTFLWRTNGSPEPTKRSPFSDVSEEQYYYKAAVWAHENGLIDGTIFNGTEPCTRAAVVTYLWKLAGSPAASGSSFADVPFDKDYSNAVAWAVSKGITGGTSGNTFSPDAICTRAQIITFIYRNAK